MVIELTGPQEWSVEQAGADVRVIVPGVGMDDGIRRVDQARGQVRSVQVVRRAGGVEVLVVCESPPKIRRLTLTDPDRIVVDFFSSSGEGEAQASVQQEPAARPSVSASSGGGGTPIRVQARSGPVTQGREASSPVREAAQPASTPPAPGKDQPGGLRDPGETQREEEAQPLTIVLDPGHGGHDTGAIGPSGLMEKDVALDLAVRLRKLLLDRLGVRVLMTRSGDVFVPLPERSAIANRAKADFMISLHVNAANSRGAVGFETFYFTREPSDSDARASAQRENLVIENNGSTGKDLEHLLKTTLADMAVTRDMKESSSLAERILAALDKILRVDNRGVKSGPFYVLATAAMPAVLVESAFITNPREERRLQREEYRQRIAEGLYEGVAAYKIRYEQRLGLRAVPAGVGS
ncbi:MAG: N-acetylmuramoyl-L-alanine amidase [candidate division NC10 bacterium]|nr:N-acetylmuramoyl-L-alanine amidase [candidate division NC10 bacterium]